jgi:hypothetical protein
VEDQDIARLEGRREKLYDIGEEAFVVDQPVEKTERLDAIVAQAAGNVAVFQCP